MADLEPERIFAAQVAEEALTHSQVGQGSPEWRPELEGVREHGRVAEVEVRHLGVEAGIVGGVDGVGAGVVILRQHSRRGGKKEEQYRE